MAGVTTTHPASPRTHGKAELMYLEEDRCSRKIIIRIFIQKIYIKVYQNSGESLESNSYIRCVGRRITNINRYVWFAAKVYKNDTPTRVHMTEEYIHTDRWDPG